MPLPLLAPGSAPGWSDIGDDLIVLARKAFPELRDESHDQIALNKYLNEVKDPRVSFEVKQRRPKMVREAVNATLELESYLFSISSGLDSRSGIPLMEDCRHNVGHEMSSTTAVYPTHSDLLAVLEKLAERVQELEQASKPISLPDRDYTLRRYKKESREITCYCCGGIGHYARGCALQTVSGKPTIKQI